jgi:RHS repeat-associated protein
MAVNGGTQYAVEYTLSGFATVQRTVYVPWLEWAWARDVVMTPFDTVVTPVAVAGASWQHAQSSLQIDTDGTRRATILFPPGTTMTKVMTTGTTIPLTGTVGIRATEYTVGERGLEAMPAELPPTSAYTYAVELDVVEAADAVRVDFNHDVYLYVDNFLAHPVGTEVPNGYYDRQAAVWTAARNGKVIGILSESGGMANLDLNGDGAADGPSALASLDITDGERTRLAVLFGPGDEFWRAPIAHFTAYDENQGVRLPDGAIEPDGGPPKSVSKEDDPCKKGGSIIGCENRSLGEAVPVAGTPFALHYQSDRAIGRTAERTVLLPVTGPLVSGPGVIGAAAAHATVYVAGRRLDTVLTPVVPNQTISFTWDGLDAFGRRVQGAVPMEYYVSYEYVPVEYVPVSGFGRSGGGGGGGGGSGGPVGVGSGPTIFANRDLSRLFLEKRWHSWIGGVTVGPEQGLAGWTLSPVHILDRHAGRLEYGYGDSHSVGSLTPEIRNVAGGGSDNAVTYSGPATGAELATARGIAVARDGTLYIANGSSIRQVAPDGTMTTLLGMSGSGNSNGPTAAASAQIGQAAGLALGPDGSLYVADTLWLKVRRIGTDASRTVTTVAGYHGGVEVGGSDPESAYGDGGPATAARFNTDGVQHIAITADGALYIGGGSRVRRVGPDGVIETVGRDNTVCTANRGDGGYAFDACLSVNGMAVAPDGNVYISDSYDSRVRRIRPDGIIEPFAGTGTIGTDGDGGPALAASLVKPAGLVVGNDGAVYIAQGPNLEEQGHRVRRVSHGIISTVVGTGESGLDGDGGPATAAKLGTPLYLAFGPDRSLYVSCNFNKGVRKIYQGKPGFSFGEIYVASRDGGRVYFFDDRGRHLRTADSLTGVTLYEFAYDGDGLLESITDVDGLVTSIERNPTTGVPIAIHAPFGQVTALSVDADGYLESIANPALETVELQYFAGGLLEWMEDARNNRYQFTYDVDGGLATDSDPEGGIQALARSRIPNGYRIAHDIGIGLTTTYDVTRDATGTIVRETEDPVGLVTTWTRSLNGHIELESPDGTLVATSYQPDGRFGMQAPIASSVTLSTPGLTNLSASSARSLVLANDDDPLSVVSATSTATVGTRQYETTYDRAANTLTIQSPMGRESVLTMDAQGRTISAMGYGLEPITTTYYPNGAVHTVTQGTRTWTSTYDTLGRLDTLTDPLAQVTEFEYDAADRVAHTTRGAVDVGATYDANGNLWTVTPPGQPSHSMTYSGVDLLTSVTAPSPSPGSPATTTSYFYDDTRRLDYATRADGTLVDAQYDAAGRLWKIVAPEGTTTISYDATTGLPTSVENANVTVTSSYFGSYLADESWSGDITGTVHRTYDVNHGIGSVQINSDPAILYGYDGDGLPNGAGGLSITRSAISGSYETGTLASTVDERTFDSYGGIDSYVARFGATELFSVTYTPDELGRIQAKSETILGAKIDTEYVYDDPVGRLTDVYLTDATAMTTHTHYDYDYNGNRLAVDRDGTVTTATYDDQDRIQTHGGATSYTFDPSGNLESRVSGGVTTTYEFDSFGTLARVQGAGTAVDYITDPLGRRVAKYVNSTFSEGFLYFDGIRPVAQLSAPGVVAATFVYASGRHVPDYIIKGSQTYRVFSDHLGSPRLVVNSATGAVAQRIDYDEFGNITYETGIGFQPFGFAGGLRDTDTGLVHFGRRDYDPAIGRWISRDPIGFASGDVNLYAYVSNDPVNAIDPSGLISWEDVGNFSAGFGDYISNIDGGTALAWHMAGYRSPTQGIRQMAGWDGAVDPCSAAYGWGETAGEVWVEIMLWRATAGVGKAGRLARPARTARAVPQSLGAAAAPTPQGSLTRVAARFLKSKGLDPHELKQGLGKMGEIDIYMDRAGNLFVKAKGAADEFAEWIGHIDDAL